MAGDWIKMRTDLYRDPKVCMIADHIGSHDSELARYVDQHCQRKMAITRNALRNVTVGALVTVWGVTRHRGKRVGDDLVIRGATLAVLDDISEIPGFGDAMASVGWAAEDENGVVLPHFFEEYNVEPSDDQKEKNAERQRRFRENRNALRNVTVTSQRNDRGEGEESSESESETETKAKPRSDATKKRLAAESAWNSTPEAKALAEIAVESIAGGGSLRDLPGLERDQVVAWWRRHIHNKPLTGNTALDLTLVLCWAANCRAARKSIESKLAAFCAGIASGKWLDQSTGMAAEYGWLRDKIEAGYVLVRYKEAVA